MAPMVGTTGKAAWRLLAAVPFVLLLGIVGIKATAGDPSSPFNKIPGAETIQDLGEDAPSSNVNVKLPKSSSPKPTKSASASASDEPSDTTTSAAPTQAPEPTRTTRTPKPAPKPTRTSSTPKPTPTTQEPTPDPPPTCEEKYAGKPLKIIQCNNGWIS